MKYNLGPLGEHSVQTNALGSHLRRHLQSRSAELARQWLDILQERLPEDSKRIFPEQTLLNHVPLMLRRIAEAFEGDDPSQRSEVRVELATIAELRRSQGYTVDELVTELDLLGTIVGDEIEKVCVEFPGATVPRSFTMARRLQAALDGMTRVSVKAFNRRASHEHAARSQLLSDFGRHISHELRNRLNTVSLALDICNDVATARGATEIAESLKDVRVRLDRVAEVVPDVFAVSVAQGRPDPEGIDVGSLRKLVTEALVDLEPLARSRTVRVLIQGEIPDDLCDAARVRLIVVNLVSNAIKYCDYDKTDRWVRIKAFRSDEDREMQLEVHDNGVGVAAEDRERIFEANQRGREVGDREGHGLGLALARTAADQMDAKIWLKESDEATVFCVSLPRPAARIEDAPDGESTPEPDGAPPVV